VHLLPQPVALVRERDVHVLEAHAPAVGLQHNKQQTMEQLATSRLRTKERKDPAAAQHPRTFGHHNRFDEQLM
jgi:hypothetical protein